MRLLIILALHLVLCSLSSRLLITSDGTLRERGSGIPFVAKGVNFGMRITPKSTGHGYDMGPYNASDVTLAKQLLPGMNLVRLVLDYYSDGTCATDIFCADAAATGYICEPWLAYIDTAVRWTEAAGVRLAISFRNNNGTASPHGAGLTTSTVPCDADYIGNATARARWLTSWTFLATRYLNASSIAWYEPASEPHLQHSMPSPSAPSDPWEPCHSAAEVTSLFNEVVGAIRVVDPDTPIAVAPTGYEQCPGLDIVADKLDDNNLIYALNWPCTISNSGMNYGESGACSRAGSMKKGMAQGSRACIPGCDRNEPDDAMWTYNLSVIEAFYAPALAFRTKHHVPLWIDQLMCPPGAFGGADKWLTDSMEMIGWKDTHFSWWTWKAANSGDDTMSALTIPPGVSKRDATKYQVYQPGYDLMRKSFGDVWVAV